MTEEQRGDRVDDAVASFFPGAPPVHPEPVRSDESAHDDGLVTDDDPVLVEDGQTGAETSGPVHRAELDRVAVVAVVCSVVGLSLVAVVLGHWSLLRIRRRDLRGAAAARWALVLGYAGLVLGIAAWAVYFAVIAPEITLPR